MSKTKATAISEPLEEPKTTNVAESALKPEQNSGDLETDARSVLSNNDQGSFTAPASGIYPHQWLWDSCFIAIGQRHFDINRAQAEILHLFRGQWANGMIPNILLGPSSNNGARPQDRHDGIWRSWLNPNAPDDINTSGITQPPMIAEAVVQIGSKLKATERRAWYKQTYPALLAYHEWLYGERDPHQEGLVLQVHPWETGLDDTPPWMAELYDHLLPWWIRLMQKLQLDNVVGWFRSDKKFAGKDERLSNIEALALFDVQRRLRRKNYDFDHYIDHSLFAIEDLTFNCIFIRANQHLKTIAAAIDEKLPAELVDSIELSEKALDKLWDDYAQEYFSRDFVSHRLLKESSIATFMPLYSGSISKARAEKIVSLLENEHRFGPAYPVPSAPLDSPWFEQHHYWSGPTWVNTNWLIIDGLKRYGFDDHAEALRESTIELVQQSGFYEYFSPLDGTGAGTNNFSWTAALIIDLLHQK